MLTQQCLPILALSLILTKVDTVLAPKQNNITDIEGQKDIQAF